MSKGSQQATKAAPKHTHNNRHLSECQNKQVLRRPIFSIGQYIVLSLTEWRMKRLLYSIGQ